MLNDWDEEEYDDELDFELDDDTPKPPRKRYCRPAQSYRVGAMEYESEGGPLERLPYLKLRGRWLETIGFEVGAVLKVDATQDSITLTVMERPVHIPVKIPRKVQRAARDAAREAARQAEPAQQATAAAAPQLPGKSPSTAVSSSGSTP